MQQCHNISHVAETRSLNIIGIYLMHRVFCKACNNISENNIVQESVVWSVERKTVFKIAHKSHTLQQLCV